MKNRTSKLLSETYREEDSRPLRDKYTKHYETSTGNAICGVYEINKRNTAGPERPEKQLTMNM
jgi:hypothetical protein